ncbi:MAG: DUF1071 domain-containing protein [Paludibacteraceae bacterium]|nr:DUF1071 domain-containing protein [Paludibacteraceae bacterium]
MAEKKVEQSMFERLYSINVQDWIDKKESNGVTLSYLKWSRAWALAKKEDPNANFRIIEFTDTDGISRPYFNDPKLGYLVATEVTISGLTHRMYLPVMDYQNRAMKSEAYTIPTKNKDIVVNAATMFDWNTAIMRCLVKTIAMFGIGLYVYDGEDAPENEVKELMEKLPAAIMELNKVETIEDLDKLWNKNKALQSNLDYKNTYEMTKNKLNGCTF